MFGGANLRHLRIRETFERAAKWLAVTTALLLSLSVRAEAADFEGIPLPDRLDAVDRSFYLTSCGMREVLWYDLYLVSLYTEDRSNDLYRYRSTATPKAVRLEILYDGDVPDQIPSEWRSHLREEISREMFMVLQDLFQEVETNDVVVIAYEPQEGNALYVNGERQAFKPNGDLIHALLDLWLGQEPVSKNLRRLLLSESC